MNLHIAVAVFLNQRCRDAFNIYILLLEMINDMIENCVIFDYVCMTYVKFVMQSIILLCTPQRETFLTFVSSGSQDVAGCLL